MDFKDYYQTLGVERGADAAAVKKAYRRLARKYHPDVSKEPDAAARMSELNEAYAVLSDPEKRAAYDTLGQQRPTGAGQGASGGERGAQGFQPPPGWASGFEFSGGPGGMEGEAPTTAISSNPSSATPQRRRAGAAARARPHAGATTMPASTSTWPTPMPAPRAPCTCAAPGWTAKAACSPPSARWKCAFPRA